MSLNEKISGLEGSQLFQRIIKSAKCIPQYFDVIETFLSALFLAGSNSFRKEKKAIFFSTKCFLLYVLCRKKSDKAKGKSWRPAEIKALKVLNYLINLWKNFSFIFLRV